MQLRRLGALVALAITAAPAATAAERTVTLAIKNMSCVTCGPIIQKSLARAPGVRRVAVSVKTGAATVVFDDAKANVAALTTATAKAGFPSRVVRKTS